MKATELLANAKKSINRVWSFDLINTYELELQSYLQTYPSKVSSPEVSELQRILVQQFNKTSLLHLPDTPPPAPEFAAEYKVYTPFRIMALNVPAPEFFKQGADFTEFANKVERYCALVGATTDEKQKSLLIYLLGNQAKTLEEGISEAEYQALTFKQLKELGKKVFLSKTPHQAMREFFVTRQDSTTGLEYAKQVKILAEKAKITDEKIIINKVIEGLRDNNLKFELLKLKVEVFSVLLEQIYFLESIGSGATSVNFMGKGKQYNKNSKKQYNSTNQQKQQQSQQNKQNENKDKKKPNNKECFFCKKVGHLKKDCYSYKKWLSKKQNNEVDPESGTSNNNDIGSLFHQ